MTEEDLEFHSNELRRLRIACALLEAECAKLRAEIGALELPSNPERPEREKLRIVVKGNKAFHVVSSSRQAFKRMPHSLEALEKNLVFIPTKLQKMAWPILLQGSDTLLVAPEGCGKLMSIIPIIVDHAQTCRVIVTSTRGRCREVYSTLLNLPHVLPIFIEHLWMDGLKANVLCVPFAAFPRVARKMTKFVCVLDELDVLAEQGQSAMLSEILQILFLGDPRLVLATTRTLSQPTVDLSRQIEFPVVIGMARESDVMQQPCTTRVEICPGTERYNMVKSCLKQNAEAERVVLIVAKDRAAANSLEHRLSLDGIDAQSLHSEEAAERELAYSSLKHGQSGVYIAIPSDFGWLHETKRVDMLLNLKSVRSPSAFTMRENRVKSSGIFIMFLKSADLVCSAAWLVTLLLRRGRSIPAKLQSMFAVYDCLKLQLAGALSRGR